MVKADLHTHTQASDGSDTPFELIDKAKAAELELIAVTDHDAIGSLSAALDYGRQQGVTVVPGIEFSVVHHTDMHILGYFTDPNNKSLIDKAEQLAESRYQRMTRYIELIRAKGVDITIEDVKAQAHNGVLSRAHIAEALCAMGAVKNREDAFEKYLQKLPNEEVIQYKTPKQTCIELIHEAGGMAVLAHPIYVRDDNFEDMLDELIFYGLNGLEVFHPDHTDADAAYFEELAQKKALLATKGSDYHGIVKPSIEIGSETRSSGYVEYCVSLFYKKAKAQQY